MIQKRWFSHKDIESQVLELIRSLQQSAWKPDYVVGLTRGGLYPAVLLSHWLDVPCETLKVSLRNGNQTESACWMAEDAFGYAYSNDSDTDPSEIANRKNILIVDDINDSGETIQWIKQDWQSVCMPSSEAWNEIWHENVRFAVLVNNTASPSRVDYFATEINKYEHNTWIVFPWEEWWRRQTID